MNKKSIEQRYDKANNDWWESLSLEERQHAFYAVIKRLYQAEITDCGPISHTLFDIFNFPFTEYTWAARCGYNDLHFKLHPEYLQEEKHD